MNVMVFNVLNIVTLMEKDIWQEFICNSVAIVYIQLNCLYTVESHIFHLETD